MAALSLNSMQNTSPTLYAIIIIFFASSINVIGRRSQETHLRKVSSIDPRERWKCHLRKRSDVHGAWGVTGNMTAEHELGRVYIPHGLKSFTARDFNPGGN